MFSPGPPNLEESKSLTAPRPKASHRIPPWGGQLPKLRGGAAALGPGGLENRRSHALAKGRLPGEDAMPLKKTLDVDMKTGYGNRMEMERESCLWK